MLGHGAGLISDKNCRSMTTASNSELFSTLRMIQSIHCVDQTARVYDTQKNSLMFRNNYKKNRELCVFGLLWVVPVIQAGQILVYYHRICRTSSILCSYICCEREIYHSTI